jgi:hypothetical protein
MFPIIDHLSHLSTFELTVSIHGREMSLLEALEALAAHLRFKETRTHREEVRSLHEAPLAVKEGPPVTAVVLCRIMAGAHLQQSPVGSAPVTDESVPQNSKGAQKTRPESVSTGNNTRQLPGGKCLVLATLEEQVQWATDTPRTRVQRLLDRVRVLIEDGANEPTSYHSDTNWAEVFDLAEGLAQLKEQLPGVYRRAVVRLQFARERLQANPHDRSGLFELQKVAKQLEVAAR